MKPVSGHGGRADGVDANSEGGRLDRDSPGELDDPTLGGAVHRATPPHQARHRSGVEDDAAVTLLLEAQHRVLASEEHPAEVDRDQAVEVFERVVLESHAESRRRDADVVEQDVEPTVLVDRRRDHRLDLLLIRYVGPDGDGGATRRFNLAHSLFGVVEVDVGHDHPGAFLGEPQCRHPANPGAGAGDDGALAVQYAGHRLTRSPRRAARPG